MTFEVGKTYVHQNFLKGPKFLCLAKTPQKDFVMLSLGLNFKEDVSIFPPSYSNHYLEYVEPKSGEFWINIYPDSFQYKTKEQADSFAREDRIAIKCIRWTEGDEE